jgi:hypothetical protein
MDLREEGFYAGIYPNPRRKPWNRQSLTKSGRCSR